MPHTPHRCQWATQPVFHSYHDTEWCRPHTDERYLFEMLVLESAQAGLSWQCVLKKRSGYRAAFLGFDPKKVAQFTEEDITLLTKNAGIVHNEKQVCDRKLRCF